MILVIGSDSPWHTWLYNRKRHWSFIDRRDKKFGIIKYTLERGTEIIPDKMKSRSHIFLSNAYYNGCMILPDGREKVYHLVESCETILTSLEIAHPHTSSLFIIFIKKNYHIPYILISTLPFYSLLFSVLK